MQTKHKQRGFFWGGGYANASTNVMDAGITAAAAITGDKIAAQEQQNTNANNMAMNTSNQDFNAVQSSIGRNFSAQQVQQQEAFQQQQILQQQNYNTNMSDTAYQRGMASAKAAGLNPLLAVPGGGASSPVSGAAMGGAASSGGASAPGMIPMQNPGAAFANLGGQVSSALQAGNLASQNDLNESQANLNNKKAGVELPAVVDQIKAETGLTQSQSAQVNSTNQLLQRTLTTQDQVGGFDPKVVQDALQNQITGVDLAVKKTTYDSVVSAINSEAEAKKLNLVELRQWANANSGDAGKFLNMFKAWMQPISSAASAASHVMSAIP